MPHQIKACASSFKDWAITIGDSWSHLCPATMESACILQNVFSDQVNNFVHQAGMGFGGMLCCGQHPFHARCWCLVFVVWNLARGEFHIKQSLKCMVSENRMSRQELQGTLRREYTTWHQKSQIGGWLEKRPWLTHLNRCRIGIVHTASNTYQIGTCFHLQLHVSVPT